MNERQIYRVWANLNIEYPELTYEMVKERYMMKNYKHIPFSEVKPGSRFFTIDCDLPKPVFEHIKLYEETEDGWNACELQEGKLAAFTYSEKVYVKIKED